MLWLWLFRFVCLVEAAGPGTELFNPVGGYRDERQRIDLPTYAGNLVSLVKVRFFGHYQRKSMILGTKPTEGDVVLQY